jgi:HAD superfamily hydrolase (TIGR01662 family)
MTADLQHLEGYAVVVPSLARPSLAALLGSLAAQQGPLPREVVVVDDRCEANQSVQRDRGRRSVEFRTPSPPVLRLDQDISERLPVRVVKGPARGPAAARNLGWRLTSAPWVAFLDDDVVLPSGWADALAADLEAAGPRVAGSQGRIVVPLPAGRAPTDWERSTAGLQRARWATADMAYRREALLEVHGFDERFPRAYREDADLAMRVVAAGWTLTQGRRTIEHPVRPTTPGTSLRVQRGNADDALMRSLHGPDWRTRGGTGRGRLRRHLLTTALAAVGATALGGSTLAPDAPQRTGLRRAGALGAAGWLLVTAEFAWHRIAPGPRTPREVLEMVWTSAAIPPAATWHRAHGWWRHRHAQPWPPRVRAVLFDRDGTLVHDVPYNGDPALVAPTPEAAQSVARLRDKGIRVGVVSNQSGIARGLVTPEQVAAVNARVDALIGPFDTWQLCPHAPDQNCSCRKPRPELVRRAARDLGVDPRECVVVGDIGSDLRAAWAAGARGVLVPNAATRADEVAGAPEVATDLRHAVDLILGVSRVPG